MTTKTTTTVITDQDIKAPLNGFLSHVSGAKPLIVLRPDLTDDARWGVILDLLELYRGQGEGITWSDGTQVLHVTNHHPIFCHALASGSESKLAR